MSATKTPTMDDLTQVNALAGKHNLKMMFEDKEDSRRGTFRTKVHVGQFFAFGQGHSKREARAKAATYVLRELKRHLPCENSQQSPAPTVHKANTANASTGAQPGRRTPRNVDSNPCSYRSEGVEARWMRYPQHSPIQSRTAEPEAMVQTSKTPEPVAEDDTTQVIKLALKHKLKMRFEDLDSRRGTFQVKLHVGQFFAYGQGRSKREAWDKAATYMLRELKRHLPLGDNHRQSPTLTVHKAAFANTSTRPQAKQGRRQPCTVHSDPCSYLSERVEAQSMRYPERSPMQSKTPEPEAAVQTSRTPEPEAVVQTSRTPEPVVQTSRTPEPEAEDDLTQLTKLAQTHNMKVSTEDLDARRGTFKIKLRVGQFFAFGQGQSKKEAMAGAASYILRQLKKHLTLPENLQAEQERLKPFTVDSEPCSYLSDLVACWVGYPDYSLVQQWRGPTGWHYVMKVTLGKLWADGAGSTKEEASKNAAAEMLDQLGIFTSETLEAEV